MTDADEWRPVINSACGGYWPDFDARQELEFIRVGSRSVKRFKLSDQGPFFNIAGLYWREPQPQFTEFG